jgi:hypothetical protein
LYIRFSGLFFAVIFGRQTKKFNDIAVKSGGGTTSCQRNNFITIGQDYFRPADA